MTAVTTAAINDRTPHIHFLISSLSEARIAEIVATDLYTDFPYWLGGEIAWGAKFFMILREYRDGITIGNTPRSNAINIGHVSSWRRIGQRSDEYRVAARADYRRLYDVDFELLQNPTAVRHAKQYYVDHWLPRIIPRCSTRTTVRTAAYAGRIGHRNIARRLLDSSHPTHTGLEFRIVEKHLWHNMRDIDVLIAIRDFSRHTFDEKPPSKLINAWHAQIPLIAGYDSAYSAIGVPGVDYIRVQSERELHDALRRLCDDANFYNAIVRAGALRAQEYTHERVANSWLAAINGPISDDWADHLAYRAGRRLRQRSFQLIDVLRCRASTLKAFLVNIKGHGNHMPNDD